MHDSRLEVHFCGLTAKNPFFLSSSCVSHSYEMCARAFSMGWGGAVWKTVGVYRPRELSPRFSAYGGNGRPFSGFRNLEQISDRDYRDNFSEMARLKRDFPKHILIASLMGRGEEEWAMLASKAAEAGVDALEANISCPQMGSEDMGAAVSKDMEQIRRICRAIKRETALPLFVKLSPEGNRELASKTALDAGADGLTVVNTFPSLTMEERNGRVSPEIAGYTAVGGLSGPAVRPIAMRQLAELSAIWPGLPIHATGGCRNWTDARDYLALGAATVQVTTAVMEYGYRIIDDLIDGLSAFLEENGCGTVEALRGSALPCLTAPEQLLRGHVLPAKIQEETCVGCGRCYLSCRDGGHQAIRWERGTRRALVEPDRCVGCGLCTLVCPTHSITQRRVE